MQPDYISATMGNLFKIWNRPVNLATVMDNAPQLCRFDGNGYTIHKLEGPEAEKQPSE
jgi:stage V sporulation protein R